MFSSSPTTSFNDTFLNTTEYNYFDYPDYDFGKCVYERHEAKFIPVVYWLFFLIGLLGNLLVLWVIVFGLRLRSMTDVCLLNLALADLLLGCTLPFMAHQALDQWVFGGALCKIVLGVFTISFYSGIFFISLMSFDRYLAVVHAVYAIRARTRSFGITAAVVVWMAGILASFPELIFLRLQNVKSDFFCFPEYPESAISHFWSIFSLFKMNILGLFLPTAIMLFCYSQIIWRLCHSHSSKRQAIRLILAVVVVFLVCWVPYNITSFFYGLELLGIYTDCDFSNGIRSLLEITECIAYFHSCLNPFLYVFVGEKFRRHLLRMIYRTPCRICQVVKACLPQERIQGSVYSQTTSVDERSTAVWSRVLLWKALLRILNK